MGLSMNKARMREDSMRWQAKRDRQSYDPSPRLSPEEKAARKERRNQERLARRAAENEERERMRELRSFENALENL